MFIRIKKIQGKHYAYHVHNKRVYGKVKQKVKSYLGKAIIPQKAKNIDFFKFIDKDQNEYFTNKRYRDVIEDLLRWELLKHNLNDISINTKSYSIESNNSKVVVKLNDGYLYDQTLKNTLNYRAVGDDDYFIGKEFAETLIKSGFDVPKEIFVKLFELIKKE
jgi:hypothetical protein